MISDMSRYFGSRHGIATSPEAQDDAFNDQVVQAFKGLLQGDIKNYVIFTLQYSPAELQQIHNLQISMDITDEQREDWKDAWKEQVQERTAVPVC